MLFPGQEKLALMGFYWLYSYLKSLLSTAGGLGLSVKDTWRGASGAVCAPALLALLCCPSSFCTEDGSGVKMTIKSLEAVFLPPLADAVVTAWLSRRVWC